MTCMFRQNQQKFETLPHVRIIHNLKQWCVQHKYLFVATIFIPLKLWNPSSKTYSPSIQTQQTAHPIHFTWLDSDLNEALQHVATITGLAYAFLQLLYDYKCYNNYLGCEAPSLKMGSVCFYFLSSQFFWCADFSLWTLIGSWPDDMFFAVADQV